MEAHGFRRLRFHDLRRSGGSLLLASGVSLKQIQEWLGHSDFAVTANAYAHLEFSSKLQWRKCCPAPKKVIDKAKSVC
jgi:integrase